MINEYEKLRIPDQSGKGKDLVVEVNWEPNNPDTNECKMLKVSYPDGTIAYLKKEHFHAFLFAIGKAEEQRDLIPQKIETIRKYHTVLGITATKDIKKGEKINIMVDIPLPPVEKEIIEASKKGNRNSISNNGIWAPKS